MLVFPLSVRRLTSARTSSAPRRLEPAAPPRAAAAAPAGEVVRAAGAAAAGAAPPAAASAVVVVPAAAAAPGVAAAPAATPARTAARVAVAASVAAARRRRERPEPTEARSAPAEVSPQGSAAQRETAEATARVAPTRVPVEPSWPVPEAPRSGVAWARAEQPDRAQPADRPQVWPPAQPAVAALSARILRATEGRRFCWRERSLC